MKNFRKVLALILVVATLFSFVAMASAKTSEDYSDAAEIKYVEAVDVLSAVGILKGYDGAYHPADNVDRDEMAKMIAVLRNGGEDNSALFSGANKFADVKGSWAEGYIAYCAQLGIVAGRNATTFDPDGKVTGIEVMKMLLCVLGYDAKEQGYVGSNWKTNVLRDATKMGLMEAMEGFDPHAAASRDEAAQLMLNALKANMVVGYLGESLIKITNSFYAGHQLGDMISSNDAEKDGWEVAYCNAVISLTPLYTIIDGLDKEFARDCFGRPGDRWVYAPVAKNEFSAFYAWTPDAVLTNANNSTMKKTLESLSILDYNTGWNYFIDGELQTAKQFPADNAGNGTLVEIYNYEAATLDFANGNFKEVTDNYGDVVYGAGDVVYINTWVGTVKEVSSYYNVIELNNGLKYRLNDYEVEEDDVVLYHICNKQIADNVLDLTEDNTGDNLHDIEAIEPKVVEVEAGYAYNPTAWYNPNGDYVVADGETYNYALTFNKSFSATNAQGVDLDAGLTKFTMADVMDNELFDLYLDEYGYVIFWQVHEDEADYSIMVIEEDDVTSNYLSSVINPVNGQEIHGYEYTAMAALYGTDGDVTTVETEIDGTLFNYMKLLAHDYAVNTSGNVASLLGKGPAALVAMTTNEDDEPVLAVQEDKENYPEDDLDDYQAKYVVGTFAKAGTVLSPKTHALKEGEIYANSKTVFMIRTLTGNPKAPYAYQQVTGVENLPAAFVAENLNVVDANGTPYTNIQYFTDEDYEKFATYVFIDARFTAGADRFMLLSKAEGYGFATNYKNLYGKNYDLYEAIVDGEKSIVLADPAAVANNVGATGFTFRPGYLYENTLVYVNVEVDRNGNTYKIYAMGDEADADECGAVVYKYEVVDGETYIEVDGKVLRLADNAAIWTIVGRSNRVSAINGYIDFTESDALDNWIPVEDQLDPDYDPTEAGYNTPVKEGFSRGYLVMSEDGKLVEQVYQIATSTSGAWQ